MRWLGNILQDIRYAIRALARNPGFTLTALATLAVGVGVNAAVFTVTNTVLFRGFPLVRGNGQLLYIGTAMGSRCCFGVSYPDFKDWRAHATAFKGMGIVRGMEETLGNRGAPAYVEAVSTNTFRLVGVKPLLGRDFARSDEQPGATPVAILRYGFWQQRFARDPHIVGRVIRLDGVPTTVIGVMPRGFSFPENLDLWVPMVRTATVMKRGNRRTWFAFGRLADGATLRSARAQMRALGRRLANAHPDTNQGVTPSVMTFDQFFIGSNATLVYKSLWGAMGLILLIACANIANLLLARAVDRHLEISIRHALGAGRWRIIQQLLVESIMLSSVGGVLGWWIGKAVIGGYASALSGAGISDRIVSAWFRVLDYTMDYRVFAYLVAISIGTGLLFGLTPAIRLARRDIDAALKDGGRGISVGPRGRRLSRFLIAGEVALAAILLSAAGVMTRSVVKIYTADTGVRMTDILTMNPILPADKYSTATSRATFYDRLEARLERIPGVESVALATAVPTWHTAQLPYELAGTPPPNGRRRPTVASVAVSPGYFRTLGATVLSGRGFSDLDNGSSRPAVIVNQRFASEHWPGKNPVGKRLRLFVGKKPEAWRTIVGVVSNIVQGDPTRQRFNAAAYLPYSQSRPRGVTFLARTRVPPESLTGAFRREVHAMDPAVPPGRIAALRTLLQPKENRSIAILLLAFAAVALALASVGLYAVSAHAVRQRTRELGVRVAVGASARDIGKLVFRQAMSPLAIGLGIGLAASFAVNRLLEAYLVGVSAADPATLIATCAVLVLSSALGCLIPARRAVRVDPVTVLRHE